MSARTPFRAERFTQTFLAEEFAGGELAGRFRWARGLGWLSWDGRRWAVCPEETVVERARQWAKRKLGEASHSIRTGRSEALQEVKAWLAVARTAAGLRAIVSLARGIDGVITDAAVFDAHPDLLNAGNGVVDLRTGELSPPDPTLLLTKLAPVDYHPDATHPDWTAALQAIPEDVRAWYQVRLGQSTTGHMTPDDVLVVQQGGGENGKTTVLGAVEKTLGDYAVLVSDKVILADPRAHSTERMELRGARFALVEETPEARRLSVSLLKKVLGTPTMTARYIRQDEMRWEATHSLWLSTNYLPLVEETDHGTWRRLLALRFPYTYVKPPAVPAHEMERPADPTLRDRVRGGRDKQHEAVLAWLVTGAVAWYATRREMPPPPRRVVADTHAWRIETDLILAYLGERLVFASGAHVMATDLLDDFNAWLARHGHRVWSDKVFSSRFGGHHEVTRNHVEKGRPRGSAGLSRPPVRSTVVPIQPVPERYNAWLGVEFARESHTPADQGKTVTWD
ncbi:MAG TPA: phage/plasmid primase, P4 family [Micromonosporaceae bacterium]|nr:phage/plasmid primase, P4 family [Micromonosporaceae bacterium]